MPSMNGCGSAAGRAAQCCWQREALGVGWFFVAYFVRFCINLLIEPQLNPVKHVPWVTVSHKVMAPIWLEMGLPEMLAQWMSPLLADMLTFVIVFGTPGIFGFLIWELTANWRLFAANRSKTLDPVLVGSHGETVTRLLRPGIHSGTIPKRFAKLRRARGSRWPPAAIPCAVGKHREALHHVEISVRRYIEREFIAWFTESNGWPLPAPHVEEIHLSTNVIRAGIALPGAFEGPLVMVFRLIDGRTHLELSGKTCTEASALPVKRTLAATLVSVCKTGGVDVVEGTSRKLSRKPNRGRKVANRLCPGPNGLPLGRRASVWRSTRPGRV